MSNIKSEERPTAHGNAGEPAADERPEAGTTPAHDDAEAGASIETGTETATGPVEKDSASEKEDSGTGHPKPANWSVP